jgi:hypothetical protein
VYSPYQAQSSIENIDIENFVADGFNNIQMVIPALKTLELVFKMKDLNLKF